MVIQRAPSTAALLEPGTPGWAQRLVLKLLQTFSLQFPIQPNRIWYVTKAELPPAADWPGALVVVTDQACIGISDGGIWKRINLGGPV